MVGQKKPFSLWNIDKTGFYWKRPGHDRFLIENSILKISGSIDVKITPEFCSYRQIFVRSSSLCRTWGEHVVYKICSEYQNCGQSIWRSKYFFSSVVSYKLRALIPLYFHFCNFYEKKIRLGTSEAWLMKRLSRRPSKPGYYILDCRIFALYMAWNFISGASYYWVGGLELLLFLFEPRRKLSNQPKLPL